MERQETDRDGGRDRETERQHTRCELVWGWSWADLQAAEAQDVSRRWTGEG